MMGDYFQIALFVSIITGMLLVVFSLIALHIESRKRPNDYLERSNTIKAIEASIDEMDRTMDELKSTSKIIFDEIDQKYAELMFLYTSIEELKKSENKNTEVNTAKIPSPQKLDIVVDDHLNTSEHSQLDRILMLQQEGFSIPDIARRLNMGQGEVTLILELGKVR